MRHIHLIDTSVASDNLGDEIIVTEARQHITKVFGDAYISSSSGHDGLGHYGRKLVEDANLVMLLGTNALSAKYQLRGHFVWSVTRRDIPVLAGKVVLFGVGASKDYDTVRPRQARLLRRLLSPHHSHALRDATGVKLLTDCGLKAINTSCPTLWRYDGMQPQVPTGRAPTVCFTLTKHKGSDEDTILIESLRSCYEKLYFWPQQKRDLGYLQSLTNTDDIEIVPGNLAAYDELLANNDIDVVGTRLHGGIRGLLHGRRTLIVAIDNRARDIGQETGLPTQARNALGADLVQKLSEGFETQLNLPHDKIENFLEQFRT